MRASLGCLRKSEKNVENKCDVCGSTRMLVGPAYDRNATTCLDCGSMFARAVMTTPEPKEIKSQLSAEVAFPEGGFSTPEEAMAHLAKLKEAAKRLGKSVETREDRPTKKKHPISDIDPKMVMAELHYFQREGENFQTVLNTAKGERDVRNFNVLIWAHNHIVGNQCTNSCREILSNG